MKNESVDCVILSVPPILLMGPHLAPALLKAFAKREGFNVFCYDPSSAMFEKLSDEEKKKWPYNEFEKLFSDQSHLNAEIDEWLDKVFALEPRFIGLSTHAWASSFFIKSISERIRMRDKEIKIVIGGPIVMEIGERLKRENIVDYYVVGDGEDAFLTLLEGRTDHPNINGKIPVPISQEDFQGLPEPDFSDSNIEYYKNSKPGNRIYLIGSRGCVFNCSFCNVPSMTQKFRYKDGEKFAQEIMSMQKQYGTSYIELADSITNAAPKEFRKMCNELIRLKKETKIEPKLICFFRIRKSFITKEEDFELAAKAGIKRLKIGVESGSQSVREHIGKKETNEDIFYSLEMCMKYNIKVNLLLIAGYINETAEMFNETMDFLVEIKQRGLDKVIEMVVVNELYISSNTPVFDYASSKGIFDSLSDEENQKSQEYWSLTLENGEILDRSTRLERVEVIKKFVFENYYHAKNLLVFSSNEKSSIQTATKAIP